MNTTSTSVYVDGYWFPVEFCRKKGTVYIYSLGDIDRDNFSNGPTGGHATLDDAAAAFLAAIPSERKIVTLTPKMGSPQELWTHKQLLIKDLVSSTRMFQLSGQ
jgi:hypothetical protein